MKKYLPVILILGLFAALVLFSGQAAAGARHSLDVCAATLVPSLLPFFALSNLLSALGLPDLLGGAAGGFMGKLFGVSPAGAQAFILGLSGGYPLGASVVADLRRDGRVSRSEAERLLAFCNNSGPAFILGAAGGVFQSAGAGILLYAAHVLAAVTVGILFRQRGVQTQEEKAASAPVPPFGKALAASAPVPPFGKALAASVSRAIGSTVTVCGYVVLFGALLGMLSPFIIFSPLVSALFTGFLELGSGVASMAGLSPTPPVLAAAAFILGWGGLSVHCQTLGVVAGTDIKCARHLAGRALCGVFAAVFTYLGAMLLF